MRIRTLALGLGAVTILGLTGCATQQSGTAVVAEGAQPTGGSSSQDSTDQGTDGSTESTFESPDASTTDSSSDTSAPDTSAPDTSASDPSDPSDTSDTSDTSTSDASTSETSAPATSATGAKADVWPTEICKLMPADVTKGFEKEDGDPQLRCFYTAMIDRKYHSVMISKGAFTVSPDDPSGNNHGKQIKTGTVDGRKAWSWLTDNANSAWATFDSGDGSALIGISNEAKSPEENRTDVLALAGRVSTALRSDKPMTGAVTAPPTTSHPKVPAGTRAWPAVICDLMPQNLLDDMEKARGYESQSCRLSTDTDDGFLKIEVHRTIPPTDPKDPSNGSGKEIKKESFDGREAYSYLYDSSSPDSVPSAYVVFNTGGRDWAEVHISDANVVTPVAPEKVRQEALDLAKQIAPKLPKP